MIRITLIDLVSLLKAIGVLCRHKQMTHAMRVNSHLSCFHLLLRRLFREGRNGVLDGFLVIGGGLHDLRR